MKISELLNGLIDRLLSLTQGSLEVSILKIKFQRLEKYSVCEVYANDQYQNFRILGDSQNISNIAKNFLAAIRGGYKTTGFPINLQARVGQKCIASYKISPYLRDPTAALYGLDLARTKKLKKKQSMGQKKQKESAKIKFYLDNLLS
jgi:translation elongation factor EF-4